MPFAIRKVEGGYAIFNEETGERKNKKPYPSREAAKPYLRALYANSEGADKVLKVKKK